MIDAVVFDLDGVLVDSEQLWDEVREQLARERGGRWHDRAQADMMGMSSPEWSRYMHEVIGLAEPPEEINAEVVRRLQARYRERLPLLADGGLIVVDNTLWSGRVVDDSDDESTKAIKKFNDHVREDPRVETVLLTVRDGMLLVRKR